jgi:hypothetical protein
MRFAHQFLVRERTVDLSGVETIGHRPSGCSRDRAAPVVFLPKSGALFYTLVGVAELRGSHAYRPPEYLSKWLRLV